MKISLDFLYTVKARNDPISAVMSLVSLKVSPHQKTKLIDVAERIFYGFYAF